MQSDPLLKPAIDYIEKEKDFDDIDSIENGCKICFNEILEQDIYLLDCCHQQIHEKCFTDWITKDIHKRCPCCNQSIFSNSE